MRAYEVSCNDEDHSSVIRYAERARDVDKFSNSEHCDCTLLERKVRRAPQFDKYTPPLTTANYLAEGWWFGCACCHKELHEEDQPLFDDGWVACNLDCARKAIIDSAEYGHESFVNMRAAMQRIIEKAKEPASE